MDIFSSEKRSDVMSKIKNKDTKAEVLVRKYLFSHGFRYRKNVSKLPGKPDIVLPKYKTVIFVNGCFWHKHANCNKFVVPKTRTEWWLNKINTNVERDIVNIEKLRDLGWKVFIIWECEAEKNLDEVVNKVIREMVDTLPSHE